MRIRSALTAAAFAGVIGLAAQAGLTQEPAAGTGQKAAPAEGLSVKEVITTLEAQGYSDFREIERDDGYYEVKARNRDGDVVEVHASPETGEVVRGDGEDD